DRITKSTHAVVVAFRSGVVVERMDERPEARIPAGLAEQDLLWSRATRDDVMGYTPLPAVPELVHVAVHQLHQFKAFPNEHVRVASAVLPFGKRLHHPGPL